MVSKSAQKLDAGTWGNFELCSTTVPYRLIFRSYGHEKCGKNHFGLTAKGPICIQSFDIGLEGVVEKFRKQGKEVRRTEYEFDKQEFTQAGAQAIVARFEDDYRFALQKLSKTGGLIQWDTETEFWEVCRFAEFGNKSDSPNRYERLNGWYRDLIQEAYDANVSLQLIQKVKEKWGVIKKQKADGRMVDSPFPTGEFEPVGFKEAHYLVQANLKHQWFGPGPDADVDSPEAKSRFVIKVLNCRQNMAVAGRDYTNLDFPTLGQLVFGDSDESDWV